MVDIRSEWGAVTRTTETTSFRGTADAAGASSTHRRRSKPTRGVAGGTRHRSRRAEPGRSAPRAVGASGETRRHTGTGHGYRDVAGGHPTRGCHAGLIDERGREREP